MNGRTRCVWLTTVVGGLCSVSGCSVAEDWSALSSAPEAHAAPSVMQPQEPAAQLPVIIPQPVDMQQLAPAQQTALIPQPVEAQSTAVPPSPVEQVALFTVSELDDLVGRIALYPDALVAQILPASTYPIEIVQASRMVQAGASMEQIDAQDWDPSIKALARYATVIQMMDADLGWTQRLGHAFMTQPQDVMESIQRQRTRAHSLGNLVTTPQQQVLAEGELIRITPVTTEIIYVPVYEPAYVYARPSYGSYITFSSGYSCGRWLDLDCDWRGNSCYRPGWTWDRWSDHIWIENHRITRFDCPPDRGGYSDHQWRRDDRKPRTGRGGQQERPRQTTFRQIDGAMAQAELVGPPAIPLQRGGERQRSTSHPSLVGKETPTPVGEASRRTANRPGSSANGSGGTRAPETARNAPWAPRAADTSPATTAKSPWAPRTNQPLPTPQGPGLSKPSPRQAATSTSRTTTFRAPASTPAAGIAGPPAGSRASQTATSRSSAQSSSRPAAAPAATSRTTSSPSTTFRTTTTDSRRPAMGPSAPAKSSAPSAGSNRTSKPAAAPWAGTRDGNKKTGPG